MRPSWRKSKTGASSFYGVLILVLATFFLLPAHRPDAQTYSSQVNANSKEDTRCVPMLTEGGGAGTIFQAALEIYLQHAGVYNIFKDLQGFTGLTKEELLRRLRREEQFHFTGEHAWWEPKSSTGLSWFYRGSVSYLFANAIHPAPAL